MRKRTAAREIALKLLYLKENREEGLSDLVREYFSENEADEEVKQYAASLAKGTFEKQDEIDEILKKYTDNWDLKRMAVLDRNILRFAVYELLYLSDIPPKVTINEAVNIAKKYSQENSGKFVNGVLDKINHSEEKRALGLSTDNP